MDMSLHIAIYQIHQLSFPRCLPEGSLCPVDDCMSVRMVACACVVQLLYMHTGDTMSPSAVSM